MRFRLSLYVLLLLAVSAPVFCQQPDLAEKSLEELMNITVSTASKHEQLATEAPASVTVITADEIQKYGYRTLGDVLRSVRGFYITYDRNYSYVGIRGFARPGDYNTHLLLLVDGHRLNDNVYDEAMMGTEFALDVDIIQRVEVIRGPSSSLYGSNAFFGVVNVITKRGHDLKGVETSVSAASFGSYEGRATYGTQFKDIDLFVSGTIYDSRGQNLFFPEFNSPATNHGVAVRGDDDQYKDWIATAAWRDFTLQGVYGWREKAIPTASFETVFNDRRNRTQDGRRYLDLSYEHTFAGNWYFNGRVFYDQSRYDGGYIYAGDPALNPAGVLNVDLARGEWWGTELRVSREFFRRHRITVGAELRDNLRQWQLNYDVQPFYLYTDEDRSSRDWGTYLQDEFTISPKLILNAGVRYDRYYSFGGTVNPRAGLIYRPWGRTTFKLLYGTAFRAPNVFEMFYYAPNYDFRSNLRPEKIRSTELLFEQALNKRVRFTASGYYNWIDDLISQETDPRTGNIMYRNLNGVAARGLEFELAGKIAWEIEGRASYSLEQTRDRLTKADLTNSPRHLGKLNLVVPLVREKLFAGVDAQYTSRRKTPSGSSVGSFPIFNLTLFNTRLLEHFDLSASLYNLFDKKYADPGSEEHVQNGLQQDGRNFRVKLTWRWGQR